MNSIDIAMQRGLPLNRNGKLKALVSTDVGSTRLPAITNGAAGALGAAIIDCVCAGIGVLIAGTSDGGALSVTTYDGDERSRAYVTSPDQLTVVLDALLDLAASKHIDARRKLQK